MVIFDHKGALIGNYSPARKTLKWTTEVAFYYILEIILNTFTLFDKTNPVKTHFMQLKLNVIKIIFTRTQSIVTLFSLPHIGHHFLQLTPTTNNLITDTSKETLFNNSNTIPEKEHQEVFKEL